MSEPARPILDRVLDVVARAGRAAARDLVAALGLSSGYLRLITARLVAAGRLVAVGHGRARHYVHGRDADSDAVSTQVPAAPSGRDADSDAARGTSTLVVLSTKSTTTNGCCRCYSEDETASRSNALFARIGAVLDRAVAVLERIVHRDVKPADVAATHEAAELADMVTEDAVKAGAVRTSAHGYRRSVLRNLSLDPVALADARKRRAEKQAKDEAFHAERTLRDELRRAKRERDALALS